MPDQPVVVVPLPSTETSVSGGTRTVIVGGQPTQGTTLSDGSVAYPGGTVGTN